MEYAMLVTATLTILLVAALCYALKIRNTYVVLGLQFILSFAATYSLTHYVAGDMYHYGAIALICAVICLFIFGFSYFLKKTVGPLENRRTGPEETRRQEFLKRHHIS